MVRNYVYDVSDPSGSMSEHKAALVTLPAHFQPGEVTEQGAYYFSNINVSELGTTVVTSPFGTGRDVLLKAGLDDSVLAVSTTFWAATLAADALAKQGHENLTSQVFEIRLSIGEDSNIDSMRRELFAVLSALGVTETSGFAITETTHGYGVSGIFGSGYVSATAMLSSKTSASLRVMRTTTKSRFSFSVDFADAVHPVEIYVDDASGRHSVRPSYESVARQFWQKLEVVEQCSQLIKQLLR